MPPHRRQAVNVIRRGGDHLLSLIEGTLDIARIEGGKLALDVRPMRFADCVQEIARMFELQAAGKCIGFRYEVEGAVPEAVRADEKRMRQILINVIGNAVKFTSHGEVVFRLHHARAMARFEIEDSGPGMTPEELERVFEPFERGSAAGDAASGGTGLGLTIAKMLTDLMGGEMTVASTPGRGTTFRLKLFLPEVRAEVAERELPPARPAREVHAACSAAAGRRAAEPRRVARAQRHGESRLLPGHRRQARSDRGRQPAMRGLRRPPAALAREFQFDAITRILRKALDESRTA